jgi:predicted transcriptional regulator
MAITIDCSDLAGTYNLDEAKDLVIELQKRINSAMKEEAAQEDNDLKYMGAMKKVIRHANIVRMYESKMLDKLRDKGVFVAEHEEGSRIVITPVEGTSITFYPKSDKCQIHSENRWVKHAYSFINKQFKLGL